MQEGGGAEKKGGDKDPRRTFEELSDYDAERVIEDEDMGLSDEWEVRSSRHPFRD